MDNGSPQYMTFNYVKNEWWAFNTYKRIWSLEMQEQLPLFAFSPKRGKGEATTILPTWRWQQRSGIMTQTMPEKKSNKTKNP